MSLVQDDEQVRQVILDKMNSIQKDVQVLISSLTFVPTTFRLKTLICCMFVFKG